MFIYDPSAKVWQESKKFTKGMICIFRNKFTKLIANVAEAETDITLLISFIVLSPSLQNSEK